MEEALELAENAIGQNSHDTGLESSLARARVRSAFISLKRFDLQRARELLIRGRADPREVICLYPRLLPASSNFTRSVWALNDVADVNQVSRLKNTRARKYARNIHSSIYARINARIYARIYARTS